MSNIIEKKPEQSINNNVKKIINLISFKTDKPQILGSAGLKSSLYSADIDLFSVIELDSIDPRTQIYNEFKKIINNINKNNNVYLIDFKCGLDDQLYQDLNSVEEIKNFYDEKKSLLNNEQKRMINKINNLDELKEYTRMIYTLRWNLVEINRGYKILYPKRQKTFIDSIDDKTIIKLDIIALINCKFIEMSNIFEFYNKEGKVLNIKQTNIFNRIIDDIKSLKKNKQYMKMFKRYFSLAKIQKKINLLESLIKLFNSNLGLIYKVKSDFKTLIDLMNLNNPPMKEIFNNIQMLKSQLGNVYEYQLDNSIFSKIDDIEKGKTKKIIIKRLSFIVDYLNDFVNKHTYDYALNDKILKNILK